MIEVESGVLSPVGTEYSGEFDVECSTKEEDQEILSPCDRKIMEFEASTLYYGTCMRKEIDFLPMR